MVACQELPELPSAACSITSSIMAIVEVVFHKPGDYDALVDATIDARARLRRDIRGYCLMPNHFHEVVELAPSGLSCSELEGPRIAHRERMRGMHRYSLFSLAIPTARRYDWPKAEDDS
jgi:hypothetical protein